MKPLIKAARLYEIARAPISSFEPLGKNLLEDEGRHLIYIDRGSDILGVAHLDSVLPLSSFAEVRWGNKQVIFSETFDDRLGVYILLEVLPSMGIVCDVLLTEDEERCNSTAQYFKTDKQYKWMFQFDRAGTDVVMYNYESMELQNALEELNFIQGIGSYSDICELEHMGCKGLNFGTGYYGNHTAWGHAIINETTMMLQAFKQFYNKYKDTYMPHAPSSRRASSWKSACNWDWGDENDTYTYIQRGFPRTHEIDEEPEKWFQVREGDIVKYVPSWRISDYLKEHPGTEITPVEIDWASRTKPPANIKVSKARWELDGEPPIDGNIYATMFENLKDTGFSDEEAHREAWAAARACYIEDMQNEEKCLICGRPECAGMHTCEVCGLNTHGDEYCRTTGMCLNCNAKIENGWEEEWRQ